FSLVQSLPRVLCFNETAPTAIYALSLHDALPIFLHGAQPRARTLGQLAQRHERDPREPVAAAARRQQRREPARPFARRLGAGARDRKSTRLNSSHVKISYAVFCLKKKKKNTNTKH